MRLLELQGFQRVTHYSGGIVGWRKANLPFDTGRTRSVEPEHLGSEGSEAPGRSP